MFFERDIYSNHDKSLVKWATEFSDYVLYLSGPRQVGKTSILDKLGTEHFEKYVYINLRSDEDREQFETIYHRHKEKHGYSKQDEAYAPMWEDIFKDCDPGYTNDKKTLVVIDEIQESTIAYGGIRQIRRGLKSCLAVSGSYLGIISNFKGYNIPAGDIFTVEMSSLTFTEFLKANNVWEDYALISTFDWAQMTDTEKAICERVRTLYHVYCQIGGYPEVVRRWVAHEDIDFCKLLTAELLQMFYRESSGYFGEIVGRTLWRNTLQKVATHMITKSGDLDITIAKETFRDDSSQGLNIRRKDKINALKWLDECCIIGIVSVYDKLEKVVNTSNKLLFYFRDMGLLTRLCKSSLQVLPSDIAGMYAENFVYLHLLEETERLFIEDSVHSFNADWGQIDFVMHDNHRKRYGIEVKFGKGETKSADTALRQGRIDFLIKVQDTYGSIQDNHATIPIFMLDKLKHVVYMSFGMEQTN